MHRADFKFTLSSWPYDVAPCMHTWAQHGPAWKVFCKCENMLILTILSGIIKLTNKDSVRMIHTEKLKGDN